MNKLNRLISFLLCGATIFVLSSCGTSIDKAAPDAKTSEMVEKFFSDHNEADQFYSIFSQVYFLQLPRPQNASDTYRYDGFTSPADIASDNLYNLFCVVSSGTTELDSYYDPEKEAYSIPVSYIRSVLDRYFESYSFDPTKVKAFIGYNNATDTFDVSEPVHLGSFAMTQFSRAEIIGNDEIGITYISYTDDSQKNIAFESTLVIKVMDEATYNFKSYTVKYS